MMSDYVCAIAGFALVLLLSLVCLQVTARTNPFLVLITLAILINVCTAAGAHLFIPTLRYWHYTPPFFLLVMITIFCLGAVFSSASLQVLQAISQSGGKATAATLHEGVIKENLFKRLDEHVAANRVRQSGDAYRVTENGRSLITWIEKFKRFFSIEQTGIY
ncbi:MAG: hypothetical protein Q8M19_08185 [Reyranella sp.]|nr:hypothetical protein [Reyranella sp.]